MKYIILGVIFLSFSSCDNTSKNGREASKIAEKSEKILQEELVEEFGEYKENVKPEDRKYYNAYDKTLKLFKIPFQEVHVPTSKGLAHVIVSGSKDSEPLVLVHGLNASSTMWYPNIKELSKNYRVYAIDYLIEPGKSVMTGNVAGISDVMDWYYEIFDQLELKEFSLIGASQGGWLSTEIALKNPSRIKSLVLLSPLQTFKWITPSLKMTLDITHAIYPNRIFLRDVLKTMSVDVDNMEKAYIEQYFIALKKAHISLKMFQMVPFSNEEFKTLTMPILVLIGDDDIINKEKSIEKAKAVLPQSENYIIKNAGHFLSMDQADVVNEKIVNFLNKNIKTPENSIAE